MGIKTCFTRWIEIIITSLKNLPTTWGLRLSSLSSLAGAC